MSEFLSRVCITQFKETFKNYCEFSLNATSLNARTPLLILIDFNLPKCNTSLGARLRMVFRYVALSESSLYDIYGVRLFLYLKDPNFRKYDIPGQNYDMHSIEISFFRHVNCRHVECLKFTI